MYTDLSPADKVEFEKAYSAAYKPAREICEEMYDEVASGNEIRSVVMAGGRHRDFPMGKIDGTFTWQVGEKVRATRDESKVNHILSQILSHTPENMGRNMLYHFLLILFTKIYT